MLDHIAAERVLFIDVETVPAEPSFECLDEDFQAFWTRKSAAFRTEEETPAQVYERAGIYAEFGKIVCVSAGVITLREGARWFRAKSFYGRDERQLLLDFGRVLDAFTVQPGHFICGHNARDFDFPFIARRMLINGIKLPQALDVAGKKPWELNFLDTMDLWKFGDFRHSTSLALLAKILGVPTPKDDIDGSQVARVFYEEEDVERIARYCEKDILATAQVFLRLKGEALLDPERVERA